MNDRRPARRPPGLARGARAARPPPSPSDNRRHEARRRSVRRVRPSLGLPTQGPARRCPRSPATPHTQMSVTSR